MRGLLDAMQIRIEPVTAEHADEALRAHARYGKGRSHPAQLNMGDCFAYAVAKSRRAALLYKGNDFGYTDLRSATEST